jgi:uncharacterized protein YlxW (UPF0749 family)
MRAGPPGEALRRLRPTRATILVALPAAVLGFGLVVQVRAAGRDSGLTTARQEDLVRILDDLTSREERLRAEIATLQQTRDRLTTGLDQDAAALEEARRRAEVLGILAGTLPARGPGIELVVEDPQRTVTADVLLDAVQELRDAGAEAIQLGDVRLVAGSYLVDADGGIEVDGTVVTAPYRFLAVGDARTLAEAMEIPGGVVDAVAAKAGANAVVRTRREVVVDALKAIAPPRYARPSPAP